MSGIDAQSVRVRPHYIPPYRPSASHNATTTALSSLACVFYLVMSKNRLAVPSRASWSYQGLDGLALVSGDSQAVALVLDQCRSGIGPGQETVAQVLGQGGGTSIDLDRSGIGRILLQRREPRHSAHARTRRGHPQTTAPPSIVYIG